MGLRYILYVALSVAVVAASFTAGMVVGEVTSATGNFAQYLAIAALIAIGAILVSAILSHAIVVGRLRRAVRRRQS